MPGTDQAGRSGKGLGRFAAAGVAGAFLWGAQMACAAFVALSMVQERNIGERVVAILSIYFAGGFLAFLVTFPVARWLRHRVATAVGLILVACILAGLTFAATAGVLALEYRNYYAAWHAAALSRTWIYQQVFTVLGSTYQFVVIGLRLYWPLGPVFLLLTSWWLSRKTS